MKGATLDKVRLDIHEDTIGYGRYIVHYTDTTCIVWDDKLQVHKHPERYLRVDAVDEMDAAVKGMAKLRLIYGANNVSLGGHICK